MELLKWAKMDSREGHRADRTSVIVQGEFRKCRVDQLLMRLDNGKGGAEPDSEENLDLELGVPAETVTEQTTAGEQPPSMSAEEALTPKRVTPPLRLILRLFL